MMVVKIEVWPGGRESAAREIERLYVWNISNLAEVSDYLFRYDLDPRDTPGEHDGMVIEHRRSDGAWELVRRVLTI